MRRLRGEKDWDWSGKQARNFLLLGEPRLVFNPPVRKERGFKVCASDPKKRFEPEWLFDLTWYVYDHDSHLKNIPLILEMEWAFSFDEVKWDFEKLVTGRADHRVFIFQAANSQRIEDYCRRLIRDIAVFEYSSRGDRYLFAGYDMKTSLFNYWPFQF